MGPKGTTKMLIDIMKERQIADDPRKYFPINKNADAERVAASENDSIYFDRVLDNPTEEEDHEVHLEKHENYKALLMTLPPSERDPEGMSMLDQHIETHKQMQAAAQNQGQPLPAGQGAGAGQQPQVDPAAAPQLQGEGIGDVLGGLAGGQV